MQDLTSDNGFWKGGVFTPTAKTPDAAIGDRMLGGLVPGRVVPPSWLHHQHERWRFAAFSSDTPTRFGNWACRGGGVFPMKTGGGEGASWRAEPRTYMLISCSVRDLQIWKVESGLDVGRRLVDDVPANVPMFLEMQRYLVCNNHISRRGMVLQEPGGSKSTWNGRTIPHGDIESFE